MTSTMKIVNLFEKENPEIVEMFKDYRHVLKCRLSSTEIENCKVVVERYINEHLLDSLYKYKLYSYKFFNSVKVEILLKPTETANIMEYHLVIGPTESHLTRIR